MTNIILFIGNFTSEELYSTGRLSSMEIVEVNPSLHGASDAKRTVEMALKLIAAGMGSDILDRNERLNRI